MKRESKNQKKTKACSGSTQSDTQASSTKDTKACAGSKKCR